MSVLILALIGSLCTQTIIQRLILAGLESNTFQKKSRPSSRVIDFMLKGKSLTDFTNAKFFRKLSKNFQDHLR